MYLTSYRGRVNEWLNRQPTWRFALFFAVSDLALLLIGIGVAWLINGRLNLSFFAGYIPVVVVLTTAGAVFSRQQRERQRREG
jgi:hypothetical protein